MSDQTAAAASPISSDQETADVPLTTRDLFELYCQDPNGVSGFFPGLEEAWAEAKKGNVQSCYAKEAAGDRTVVLTEEDQKTTSIIAQEGQTPDDAVLHGLLVGICATWNKSEAAQRTSVQGHDEVRAALIVCPDSPFADAMQAHLKTPAVAAPTATPQPTVEAVPEVTPTTEAPKTRKITYIVEATGPISLITYSNFINSKMGQEQSSGEVTGTVKKTYEFPEEAFAGMQHGSFWSLGVSAQAGAGTTSITCRILSDGHEMSKQTSTGEYAVVTCNIGA
ncbi:hypothetical protein B1A87_006915 [Arthrobacter sp. KBS0703]|uniref:hypothetical protein n=1 Tax=Arthrobacter sp. KBS0703 TaxID=1955698 RepID=UPI001116215A|nr:hypothetical protein [Arthrobacter sp. KBS0703]TSE15671.1 hypothetical protein B1A87_006915 [Arthrobacter sp. KBS0703]